MTTDIPTTLNDDDVDVSNTIFNSREEGLLNTPWDKCYNQTLIRRSPMIDDAPHILDFGVNYFVLKLESLGIKTCWSCEGHPNNFYIAFKTSFKTATRIAYASTNYSSVEIMRGVKKFTRGSNDITYFKKPWWRMALHPHNGSYEERNMMLRELSLQWENEL